MDHQRGGHADAPVDAEDGLPPRHRNIFRLPHVRNRRGICELESVACISV